MTLTEIPIALSFAVLLLSLTTVLISGFLFQTAAGSLHPLRLNMISYLFYLPLCVQSLLGSILVVLRLDGHYLISRLRTPEPRLIGWVCVLYALIALPAAMILTARALGITDIRSYIAEFTSRGTTPYHPRSASLERGVLWVLSAFSLAAIGYVIFKTERIPIFEALKGASAEDLARLRIIATREFPGIVYIKTLGGKLMAPLLAYTAYAYWHMTRRRSDLLWFLTMASGAVFILSYNMEKAPVNFFFIGFLFEWVLLTGRTTILKTATIGVLVVSVLLMQYQKTTAQAPTQLVSSYKTGIPGRLTLSEAAGLFLTFEYFPERHPFLGLSSFSRPLAKIAGQPYSARSARILMEHYRPDTIAKGTGGVMSSLFMAEAWANFGLTGLLLAPWIVGAVLQVIFLGLLSLRKTPFVVGLATSISLGFKLTGGFNDFLYNPALLILGVIAFIVWFFPSLARLVFDQPTLQR
jgi:hypothetical protein